jgi:hypothetical protein
MLGVFTVTAAVPSREAAHFCVAVARALAARSYRTVLVDLCTERPMLDLALGVGERVLYTVRDVLSGSVPLSAALLSPLCKTKKGEQTDDRILLLPGEVGISFPKEATTAITTQLAALSADAVFLLTDAGTAPLVRDNTDAVLLLTDGSEESLRAEIPLCSGQTPMGVILSHFILTAEAAKSTVAPRALADVLGAPIVGILPHSDTRTVGEKPSREFLAGVSNVADRLIGKQLPLLDGIAIEGMRRRKYLER